MTDRVIRRQLGFSLPAKLKAELDRMLCRRGLSQQQFLSDLVSREMDQMRREDLASGDGRLAS